MKRFNIFRVQRFILRLSQAEVARRVGISRPWLSQIETRQVTPSPKVKVRLANVLGVAVCELFADEAREGAE